MTITIVHEDDDIIVVDKPAGMPSAPLKKHAGGQPQSPASSALEEICRLCPAVRSVAGRNAWEAGLVHRLDAATRGLLLAAKNQRAFDFLLNEQEAGRFEKRYRALVTRTNIQREGFPLPPRFDEAGHIVCESKFRAWGRGGKEVRPVVCSENNQPKKQAEKKAAPQTYTTIIHIKKVSIENLFDSINNHTSIDIDTAFPLETLVRCLKNRTVFLADCTVVRGFRHQVRAHLAWLGYPVIGDSVYGWTPGPADCAELPAPQNVPMLFFAAGLRFRHPAAGGVIELCSCAVPFTLYGNMIKII